MFLSMIFIKILVQCSSSISSMSSRYLSFYVQRRNCSQVTYSTIRLPCIMWVENHEDYVAADKPMKHNTAWTGNAEYHEMLRSLYTKLRMRLLLTWHKPKITTDFFRKWRIMNWLALLCDPKLNAIFSFKWSVAYQDFIKTSILIVAQPRDPILVERFRL